MSIYFPFLQLNAFSLGEKVQRMESDLSELRAEIGLFFFSSFLLGLQVTRDNLLSAELVFAASTVFRVSLSKYEP